MKVSRSIIRTGCLRGAVVPIAARWLSGDVVLVVTLAIVCTSDRTSVSFVNPMAQKQKAFL